MRYRTNVLTSYCVLAVLQSIQVVDETHKYKYQLYVGMDSKDHVIPHFSS